MKKRFALCVAVMMIAGCASVDSRNSSARPWNQPPTHSAWINWWPCEWNWWSFDAARSFEEQQWVNTYGR